MPCHTVHPYMCYTICVSYLLVFFLKTINAHTLMYGSQHVFIIFLLNELDVESVHAFVCIYVLYTQSVCPSFQHVLSEAKRNETLRFNQAPPILTHSSANARNS